MKKTNFCNYLFVMVIGLFFTLSMAGFAAGANVDVYKELGKVSDHRFYYPEEIDVGPDGMIYVADSNHHAVKAFKETGENVFSIGGESGSAVGKFNYPTGIARDNDGNIWVVDYNNHRLQELTGSGGYKNTLGSNENAWNFRFNSPEDVARGADGNYWIADYNNHRVVVLSPEGKQVAIIQKVIDEKVYGSAEGQFNGPASLDFDSEGFLWVVDHVNDRLQKFDSSGAFSKALGEQGFSHYSRIGNPFFVKSLSDGSVLVSYNHNVSKFSPQGLEVMRLGNTDGSSGSEDGVFNSPQGVAVDSAGNIYVVDDNNNRVQKFNSSGVYQSSFGEYNYSFEAGKFYDPQDIDIDANGNIWVVDEYHHVIQKFNSNGEYLAHFGEYGTADGQLKSPNAIFIDSGGNLWISDDNHRVQKFNSSGAWQQTIQPMDGESYVFTTYVGDIVMDGDGYLWVADGSNNQLVRVNPANDSYTIVKSDFDDPWGLDIDAQGNLWVADNDSQRVAHCKPDGTILKAFSETNNYDDKFYQPSGIVADSTGFWVSDRDNNRVLRFNNAGTITHKIGGFYSKVFDRPEKIALAADGSLWVTDYNADAVLHFSSEGVYLGRIDNTTQTDVTLDGPSGVALYYTDTNSNDQLDVDEDEFVVVLDVLKNQVVKFKTDGTYVANLGETGYGNSLNKCDNPWGLRIFGQEVFVADSSNARVKVLALDGSYKRAYTTDGGAWGKFDNPVGIAANKTSGSIWVTDRDNDRLHEIKKNADGTWEFVRTVGGPNNGLFKNPHNIYVDVSGNVWVSDLDSDIVAKLDPEGNLLKILGDAQQVGGSFYNPGFVLGLSDGSMWVTDTVNGRVVHLDAAGNLVTLIGSSGGDNGQFENPEGIAVSGSDVYVADTINNRIQKFSSTGDFKSVFVFAGTPAGFVDKPAGMVFDSQNRLWVVERGNNRVQVFNSSGATQFIVGASTLKTPFGVAIDLDGNVWVTDTGYHRVHKFAPDNTDTILLTIGKADKTAGTGAGEFNQPYGVAVDSAGLVHVADSYHRVQVFDTDGNFQYAYGGLYYPRGISIVNSKVYVADTYRVAVFNENGALLSEVSDNGAAETGFYNPRGISMDSSGNLWVADSGNDRVVKIDPTGKVIKKVAQLLNNPIGVQVDSSDNVWVTSHSNSRVIKYDSSGKLLKVFDNAGEVFDKFNNPMDMVFHQENLYIVDRLNDRIVVQDSQGNTLRTFGVQGNEPGLLNDPWGIIVGPDDNIWISQTYGGDKITVFTPNGDFVKVIGSEGNLPGMMADPLGMAFDSAGNLWLSDANNDRLQQFSSDGKLLQTIGTYGSGQGQLDNPQDLAIDAQGRIYVCEYSNNRISVFDSSGNFLFFFGKEGVNKLTYPIGIIIGQDGHVWVADAGKDAFMVFDAEGNFLFQAGEYGAETGQFKGLGGIAMDGNGQIWVADYNNHRLQVFDLSIPETDSLELGLFHRNWRYGSEADYIVDVIPESKVILELNGSYSFGSSTGTGNVKDFVDVTWTSDDEEVATVDTDGIVTTIVTGEAKIQAQIGDQIFTATVKVWAADALPVMILGREGGNQGEYNNPTALHIHGAKLYVADYTNHRIKILDFKGNIVQVIYNPEFMKNINCMAVDADGNIYITDIQTDKVHKFDKSGNHLLSFGEYGTEDGQFKDPHGISLDSDGNLWVVDRGNHRLQKFSPDGTYQEEFGTYGYQEDSQFNSPNDVVVDSAGNLWVADNSHLKKFKPDGTFLSKVEESISPRRIWIDSKSDIWVRCNGGEIRKYAPNLTELMVYSYTTNEDEPGKLDNPQGVAVDSSGNMWVAEYDNDRLQRICFITQSLALSAPKNVVKDELQITATATYGVTTEILPAENMSAVAAWSVADETLAGVVKGLVTALKTGQTTVTAQFDGYEDSLVLDLLKFYGVEVTGNVDMENASPLIAGKSVEGTVNSGEKDFFEFTPAQAGYYRVLFSSAKEESVATLNILDAAGDVIYSNDISGGAIAVPVYLDAQNYYIRIDGGYTSNNEGYLVACLLTAAGEKGQAILLQVPASESGTLMIDSPVYYLVDLQGPRQLKVSYSTESTEADVKITVYPEEISVDTVLDQLISTDGENLESNIGLAQGKYYLEVRTTAPGDPGYWNSYGDIDDLPYTLSVQPAAFETAGEYETNNTPIFANSIEDGVSVTARNFSNQDEDYYTFHYSPDSDTDYLVFNFTPQDTEGSHTIKLLNLEENQLASYSASQGNGVVDQKINLKPGQYYLLVTDSYDKRTEYLFSIDGKISAVKKVTGVNLVLGKEEAEIKVGDIVSLTVQVFYSDGSVVEDPEGLNLISTDPAVLSVTSGQVEVVKAGSSSIIASYEGKVGALDLSVGVVKKQNYGNLIVVAGGGIDPGNKLKDITQYLCDLTYLKFKGRGFEDDDIYYFNPEPFKDLDGNGFNDGIVDSTEVTNQNFASAITTWAKDYPSTGPLYIYLNDHGANALFQVYPNQILTGAVFNGLLTSFQEDTGRTVVVIIEACHSGTFVGPLQAENRVIITSSDEEVAYLGNGGSSSFSQFFMGDLYKGASVSEAFDTAIDELGNLGKPYDGMYPQKYPEDLAALDLYVVGDFALAPMFPEIAKITLADSYDIASEVGYEIQAEVTGVTGGKVWATIKPANYAPPAVSDDFQTPDIQVPSITLVDADATTGEMDGVFEGAGDFPCNGMYDVIIFARDAEGNITQSALNAVNVSGGEECAGEESEEIVTGTGWSLLSSRISFYAADKLSDDSKFTSAWKWESGKWAVYLSDGSTQIYADSKGFSVLSTISPGEGFWVNSVGSETLSISGTPVTGSLTLTSGWNLVGLKSDQSKTVATLISGNEGNIASVWKWESGKWAVCLPGQEDGGAAYANSKGFSELENINPGEGFWVNATQQTTLD